MSAASWFCGPFANRRWRIALFAVDECDFRTDKRQRSFYKAAARFVDVTRSHKCQRAAIDDLNDRSARSFLIAVIGHDESPVQRHT